MPALAGFSVPVATEKPTGFVLSKPAVYSAMKGIIMKSSINTQETRGGSLVTFLKDLAVVVFAIFCCFLLSGLLFAHPAKAQTSTRYNGGFQQQSSVVKARVVYVRDVVLREETSQVGQVIGQALGGTLGALLGQRSGNYAVGALGATVGAIAGGAIVSRVGSSSDAQEIIVAFEDGRTSAITQSVADGVRFIAGQKVMIIGAGRVAPSI